MQWSPTALHASKGVGHCSRTEASDGPSSRSNTPWLPRLITRSWPHATWCVHTSGSALRGLNKLQKRTQFSHQSESHISIKSLCRCARFVMVYVPDPQALGIRIANAACEEAPWLALRAVIDTKGVSIRLLVFRNHLPGPHTLHLAVAQHAPACIPVMIGLKVLNTIEKRLESIMMHQHTRIDEGKMTS